MSMNFFTEQYGFQKSLIDPSSNIGAKKDYTTSLKKNEFNTSRTRQDDVDNSERSKKFAEMMNALKKKEKTAETSEDIRTNFAINNAQISMFQTQRSDLTAKDNIAIELNNIETGSTIDHIQTSLTNIAALNEEIQRLIEEQKQAGTTETQIITTSETTPEKIESILAIVAAFLSNEEENPDATNPNVSTDSDVVSILGKIEAIAKSDDALAITSGLSPEQLTKLQDNIQRYLNDELNKRDANALEALAASFVTLAPPVKTEKITKDTLENTEKATLQIIPEKSQIAAALPKEHHSQERFDARYNARYESDTPSKSTRTDNINDTSDFKAALKGSGTSTNNIMSANNDNNVKTASQQFLQTSGIVQSASALIDTTMQQSTALSTAQNAQSPLQSSLTNIITQPSSAGAHHPATQMVSATIQKAVKAGEDTNIRLKLDPPELGRVEVKMSIDKDNATKIVLTIEKPETYALLKQDAEALQRALNNAGLDTEGNLSFELASDAHDFSNDNRQSNSQGQNGKGANSNGADNDLIETTMDWQVDPDTGQMRYNALV